MRRVRPRSSRVLLVLSIGLAALATVGLRDYLARVEARAGMGGPDGPIVVPRTDLRRGAVVDRSMLEVRSVPALAPGGFRAVLVPAAVPSGTLALGDRVDVLATYPTGQPYTETVTVGAEVLLVLDGGGQDLDAGSSVVLLVGPEAAERLAHATAFAETSLAIAPAGEA